MDDFPISYPLLLDNSIKNYAWGERGKNAYIPRLLGLNVESDDTPFAELWIGTHHLSPSRVVGDSGKEIPLPELLEKYPVEILGTSVQNTYKGKLPFLLKVLSAREILSIQVHPNKAQALELHNQDSINYPDSNHKPELAIALDSLTALIGVIDNKGVHDVMKSYPELRAVTLYNRNSDQTTQTLFVNLLQTADQHPSKMVDIIETIRHRLRRKPGMFLSGKERIFLEFSVKYPGDIGLLTIFLLKLYKFSKNQAVFIPPGIPHAYVRGNIIECMASSDNVVRVGLTNKYRDIHSLIKILNDEQSPQIINMGLRFFEQRYPAPVREYCVTRRLLFPNQKIYDWGNESLRVFIVTKGVLHMEWQTKGQIFKFELSKGQSTLVPAALDKLLIRSTKVTKYFKVDVPLS